MTEADVNDSLVKELKKIFVRIKRLETRVVQDHDLCNVVRDCALRINLRLNNQQQIGML